MASIFSLNRLNNVVLSSVLLAFPLAVLTPPSAYAQINIGLNDIGFGINMQKLVDKVWKSYNKKDGDSLIEVLFDIKQEIESYRGIKINIDKEIDKIEAELKKKGHKASQRHI